MQAFVTIITEMCTCMQPFNSSQPYIEPATVASTFGCQTPRLLCDVVISLQRRCDYAVRRPFIATLYVQVHRPSSVL